MARINVSKDPSGRIIVSFPYDALLVAKVKAIEGRRWHPAEKHWSFPNAPNPPHRWGREREGVKKLESGLSPKFNASRKTTEIYTHVSNKDLMRIKNPYPSNFEEKATLSSVNKLAEIAVWVLKMPGPLRGTPSMVCQIRRMEECLDRIQGFGSRRSARFTLI
jgi:hypothetical protein